MGTELLKRVSNFLARWPGLPILLGIALVILNFLLQFFSALPVVGWFADRAFFLHLGVFVGLLGVLLKDVL